MVGHRYMYYRRQVPTGPVDWSKVVLVSSVHVSSWEAMEALTKSRRAAAEEVGKSCLIGFEAPSWCIVSALIFINI